MLPNDPPQDYILTINPQFIGNETNCLSNNTDVQEVFADQSDPTNPVKVLGCNHTLSACRVRFKGFEFRHACFIPTDPTWNTQVPDPAPLPLPTLQLHQNIFTGIGTTSRAISGIADEGMQIGREGEGNGKEVFYLAFQKGDALGTPNGNLFRDYLGPRIIELVGRNCSIQFLIRFNVFEQCLGSCINITGMGGVDVDYNIFINSGAQIADEPATVFVSVCPTNVSVPYALRARWNRFNWNLTSAPYANLTNSSIGYQTAYWFDPVQDDKMEVVISNNFGDAPGVCLREDNRKDDSPLLDPQFEAREIQLFENNLFCNGAAYDVRYLRGPSYDSVVDSDNILYVSLYPS